MKIPDSVQLLGTTIHVSVEQPRKRKAKKEFGTAYLHTGKIRVHTHVRGNEIPADIQQHTFFHELLHQVLHYGNYHELNGDEQFIDVISGLLHQALAPHMK